MARERSAPRRLILDSAAVIALARGDQRPRAYLERALELGVPIEIPVAVVAETLRGKGPRDASLHRVLNAIDVVPPTTEAIGRRAGALLGRTRMSATVDALIVAQAIESGGAHVVTGDADDLIKLAQDHADVWIHGI